MFFFSPPVSFDRFPVSHIAWVPSHVLVWGMQSKSCHNICYPSGLISSASWCKQGLLHSSMLVEVHSLEPISLSHYVYFARHRDEIPNHLVASFHFSQRASYKLHISWWNCWWWLFMVGFVVKCQGSWFQTWRFVVFFAGLIGCRSRNGCHLTPSEYYFLDLKIRQLHFWCVGYVCISVCLCV